MLNKSVFSVSGVEACFQNNIPFRGNEKVQGKASRRGYVSEKVLRQGSQVKGKVLLVYKAIATVNCG